MTTLTHALSSVESYTRFFSQQPVPVLRRTVETFAKAAENIDNITRQEIAATVQADPLMTIRLFSHIETHREITQNKDIITVNSALVMMGIVPFFKAFGDMPTVEEALASSPKALLGLIRVANRASKAAHYAHDWAVIRRDLDVNEITVAALLYEAAEMVCWLNAPDLTQRVYDMQHANRELRSAAAQREVFGITSRELQFALIRAWRLPKLLVDLLDPFRTENPRVRTITLAVDLARHVARGWHNAALPQDIASIHELLRIPPEVLLRHTEAPEEHWPALLSAIHSRSLF
ncbi:MAG: HDOD domain-containing protein [Azoarcus sp.]|jgi:HD-like signal output (HDOD) protein|nr:HDOD domain-containing protein [Azoarcus sp.]